MSNDKVKKISKIEEIEIKRIRTSFKKQWQNNLKVWIEGKIE